VSLHVERIGQGRPLVLLHGWGLHGGVFAGLAARLADRYALHVIDLPGHGRSPWKGAGSLTDWAARVAAAVPAGADWLGWSLGGMVALAAVAAARPRRLALVASNPRFVADGDWRGVETPVLEGFAADLVHDHRATLGRFLALQARGSTRAREEIRHLRGVAYGADGADGPHPAALAAGLTALRDADLRPALAAVDVPTLILGGARDTLAPAAALAKAATQLPQGRLHLIEGAGHAPFLSHPDAFDAALTEFLDE
jgi:pimeloyl-[acyl-carrier protein] methyl ester esterase